MQRCLNFFIAGSLVAGVFVGGCAGSATVEQARDEALTKAIERGMEESEVPGMIVGIWPEGQQPYVKAFGVRDKGTNEPMTTDLNHRIGSLTKTFISTIMLQLVAEGKMALDDPISDYVAGVPNGNNITLRMLSGMRTGLGSYTDTIIPAWPGERNKQWTAQQLIDAGFALPLKFSPPDSDFDYSNTNTVLLGMAIEDATDGKPLQESIQERITGPLGLTNTFLPIPDSLPAPHSKGYGAVTFKGEIYETSSWNNSWGWAAGSIISNLDDLKVYVESLGKGTLISPAMKIEREKFRAAEQEGKGVTYGLGLENDGGWIGHPGNTPGYITFGFYQPQDKITMVVMLNSSSNLVAISTMLKEITRIISPDHLWPDPPDDAE